MKRRELLKSLVAAAASGSILGCAPGEKPGTRPSGRTNILFVFADQLRPDVLGPYGGTHIATRHLDAVARQGVTFLNALSTCPVCAPYRGMLMTGRYPTHSGVLLNRVDVSARQNPDCLAQVFAAEGYDTGFLGKWHLSAGIKGISEMLGDDRQAVEEYMRQNPHVEFTPPGPDRLGFRHWEAYNYHTDFRDYWFYRDEPEKVFARGYETDVLTDQAVAFMEQRRTEGHPFLLVVAPHPPHPPFAPDYCPPGYLARVPEQLDWNPNVPEEKVRELELQMRCYLAMVKHFDDCIGRLVRYLDESGLSEDTLLVVTSDHGEMHGSHGLIGKKYPYAESVNVPLVMRWPGTIPADVRTPVPYTPMDHMPTLCSLAGVPPPASADGTNLSALLQGGTGPERDGVLMMNYVASYANFRSGGVRPEWRGVHTGRYTYVKWLGGREALFDNSEDPYQMQNLVEDEARGPVLQHLRSRLNDLLSDAHDEFLPGTAYAEWYETGRKLVRTALGPVV
jgi:arylsulfatase A-like enzyme